MTVPHKMFNNNLSFWHMASASLNIYWEICPIMWEAIYLIEKCDSVPK